MLILFAKPEKGKGGTKTISLISYVVLSPISKNFALNSIVSGQFSSISSPASTYGLPGIVAPAII